MICSHIFREYDIRGEVDTELTVDLVESIGYHFAAMAREKNLCHIGVGYDGRLTSPKLEAAFVEGLVRGGVHAKRIGLVPTPTLYFAQKYYPLDGGVIITGSHNPPQFNGLKFVLGGDPFFGEDIQRLRCRVETEDDHSLSLSPGKVSHGEVITDYLNFILQDEDRYYSKGRPLKVAWDGGNGAASVVIPTLIERLRGQHILINCEVDGTFPAHHPDPTDIKNLRQLQELVLREHCDLGIAFDGDADRIGIVDNKGNPIWGDQLMVLFSEEVLRENPGATIIGDIKASQGLYKAISSLGGEPFMWKTGHSLIKTKMKELKAPLAGEMSGHIFFADRNNFGYDDAIYAALRTIGIVSGLSGSLNSWFKNLPVTYITPEYRIECQHLNKFLIVNQIQDTLRRAQLSFHDIDGIRVEYPDGWWLVRASNTQEVLVARAESSSSAGLEKIMRDLKTCLKENGVELLPTEE